MHIYVFMDVILCAKHFRNMFKLCWNSLVNLILRPLGSWVMLDSDELLCITDDLACTDFDFQQN